MLSVLTLIFFLGFGDWRGGLQTGSFFIKVPIEFYVFPGRKRPKITNTLFAKSKKVCLVFGESNILMSWRFYYLAM